MLDDDPARIDRAAVHAFITDELLGARARARELMDELIADAARVGRALRPRTAASSASRASSPTATRSRTSRTCTCWRRHAAAGFGLELVRFTVDDGPLAGTKWILHTRDMHRLYAKLGFVAPGERTMER